MKIQVRPSKHTRGFTLIEMIGVLAVIAILAALLVPKIFEAINNARVNNAAVSYNTAKTALADHYAKFGTMLSSNGTPIVAGVGESTNFDKVLVAEAFMDKPFIVKIGDGTGNRVEIIPAVT
ncbi:MAG TPA: prepilin-type N-terminal cleavage/methylation domain-containing protein, partial [Candidatus Dormibacteraeota bacterium]|nr:prepilin-type N-terminal cleavage/methylation domain-containing protein [Candidatus Dormibacteraeota bacterium]